MYGMCRMFFYYIIINFLYYLLYFGWVNFCFSHKMWNEKKNNNFNKYKNTTLMIWRRQKNYLKIWKIIIKKFTTIFNNRIFLKCLIFFYDQFLLTNIMSRSLLVQYIIFKLIFMSKNIYFFPVHLKYRYLLCLKKKFNLRNFIFLFLYYVS